ncbi:hypothetical protein N7499_008337 [Penicillium canescens]|uniref:Rhodanese domain-containing protein n=1 Tax=Penicillium canescens TaxID=5083 RepID=A0AAD6N2N7_PENCN|nr:uncharacterized protein N7446_013371 [Penicillium canescens]KAJ5985384.1 hypothetical protein N7522_012580 [Penicillium canescens]KAJ6023019.1 hypothetical protein N7460_013414 [Penicillium canescens]KAJ6025719.1 hypothetical protein N7444_013398 [Penicillium canescens]KAJ6042305.1 hypothetical protein N7446_013371 [Penicillium canescens]KAJ6076356.1 hypothetical protein N7499_008337 [Penicillium canescens]
MSSEAPWHAAFPAPKSVAPSISREEFLQWIREGKQAGKDFVLVDLRRNDYEGGTIQGSLNLPAQSLYPTIPTLYSLVSNSSAKFVIWYCGSSAGRGTRAAGWFADYLKEKNDTEIKSLVLAGGIKGWAAAGTEYTALMDGYDASVWTK